MSDPNLLIPEVGAIALWHRELAASKRTKYDIDALSRAACCEANAREWTFHPPTCNEYRRQAAELIREA